jgi:hypothetical protein
MDIFKIKTKTEEGKEVEKTYSFSVLGLFVLTVILGGISIEITGNKG